MTKIIAEHDTHILVYVGAPYGALEGGHVEFAGSEQTCLQRARKLAPGTDFRVVTLDRVGLPRYTGGCKTAREYFEQ